MYIGENIWHNLIHAVLNKRVLIDLKHNDVSLPLMPQSFLN